MFRPKHNTIVRVALATLLLLILGGVCGLMVYARTPYARGTQTPVAQPIQFDHRHHTRDDGIDCRYCHDTVDQSPHAGIPATSLCMGCHSQIWNTSPLLEPVRASFYENQPIKWTRVHKVPEFVYFNHAIHVAKGVGCVSCHGRVDQMAAVQQVESLTMGWCLDCHRDPTPHLRPRSEITNMAWTPPAGDPGFGQRLADELGVHTRISCTTCHR